VAWRLTLLLTVAYIVSFLDRFVISLLIEPIKASMQLNDFQIGLLLGPAFAIFYLTLGIPIGWLADRGARRPLIAAGIALWSLMTALCGLAPSFWPLFLARIGVGVGEAVLAPCAVPMIGDAFPPERRARPISVYMSGSFLGSAASFLLGGLLVGLVEGFAPLTLPVVGRLEAWQLVFIIVGLPGVLLAALMYTVPEPPRRLPPPSASAGAADAPPAGEASAVPYMRSHWRAYGALLTGMAGVFAMGSLAQWNVALFQRNWAWGIAEIGVATGLLILCSAVPGTVVSGWLTTSLQRRGRTDAPLQVVTLGLLIFAPAACLAPLMPDARVALGVFAVAFFGQAIAVAAGPAALVDLTPAPIRSRAVAVYWSAISLVGMLIGPASVGALTDAFGDPAALKYSLAIMALAFAVPALAALLAGRAAYQRSIAAMPRSV
jgi:MFS family permease